MNSHIRLHAKRPQNCGLFCMLATVIASCFSFREKALVVTLGAFVATFIAIAAT